MFLPRGRLTIRWSQQPLPLEYSASHHVWVYYFPAMWGCQGCGSALALGGNTVMEPPHKPRNSWSNILFGVAIMFFGLSFCVSGLTALKTGTTVPGNWKRPSMNGTQAFFAGAAFLVGGSVWFWTCFRKDR